MASSSPKPYIILVGDVGSGKSTIVEKITGTTKRSSNASKSFTTSVEAVMALNESLIICDTPGSNSMENRFESNLHIARAMNFMPVSAVLTVFKADVRIDNVIEKITSYLERFLPEDFPEELIVVCVTHMDAVEWGKEELIRTVNHELGIETVIFSASNYSGDVLCKELKSQILKITPRKLDIQSETFLKLFKINDKNLKVLRGVKSEITKFEKLKQDFYNQRDEPGNYGKNDQMDMTFEFQAWTFEEIIEAQKRLSDKNSFDFDPDSLRTASEAGHIASMTNQLRTILTDVRIDAMKYHREFDSYFRKCPNCGEVWTKIEGCEGNTHCGAQPRQQRDANNDSRKMSTFKFVWFVDNEKLGISKNEVKPNKEPGNSSMTGKKGGCGKTIAWKDMSPVTIPAEFDVSPTFTKDVPIVNQERHARSFNTAFKNAYNKLSPMRIASAKDGPRTSKK